MDNINLFKKYELINKSKWESTHIRELQEEEDNAEIQKKWIVMFRGILVPQIVALRVWQWFMENKELQLKLLQTAGHRIINGELYVKTGSQLILLNYYPECCHWGKFLPQKSDLKGITNSSQSWICQNKDVIECEKMDESKKKHYEKILLCVQGNISIPKWQDQNKGTNMRHVSEKHRLLQAESIQYLHLFGGVP